MNQKVKTGIVVVASLGVLAFFFVFSNPFATTISTSAVAPSQLIVQDEVVGTGSVAAPGDVLTVNYTGKLEDGTVFDTSVGGAPYQFVLGSGLTIAGWDQGLVGMKVGGKRLLVIPSDLAFGAEGNGPVPPNATLIFEVDLLAITPGSGVQR